MQYSLPITAISGVGPQYVKKLEKLQIKTVWELLHHIPTRYIDYSKILRVYNFQKGETGTVIGVIKEFQNQYTKNGKRMQIATLTDDTGSIQAIWFNQSFLSTTLRPGTKVALSGECGFWAKGKALYAPEYELVIEGEPLLHTGRLVPVYPQTAGVSSKWIRAKMWKALEGITLEEFLPDQLLMDKNWPPLFDALLSIHFPKSLDEVEKARKRLAMNELLFLQLQNMYKKRDWQHNQPSYFLSASEEVVEKFISTLPFDLTSAQKRVITEVREDLEKDIPMNRLLEGDVGSGKTVIAAAGAFVAHHNGYQTVVMAPTQILATQHFNTLTALFEPFGMSVALVTAETRSTRVKKADVYVGTHALIHKGVDFDEVALVVIDEQHRFGVEQRAHLIKKSEKGLFAPHVLTMTATPIPRTVALTLYGDLELSILDELPKGRQEITTWVIPPHKRSGAYEWIESQLSTHHSQCFIVCPLIDESESESLSQVKAATTEFENFKKIFKAFRVGLLHGRMKNDEKNDVLDKFRAQEVEILVTTPVVEVGVDIPNATIMMIETAERFGLAQLHQLRGRVGRGAKQSYCLLFTETKSVESLERLKAMKDLHSGFELAELD